MSTTHRCLLATLPPPWSKKRAASDNYTDLYANIQRRKFYDLLEVPVDASEPDLKKAYRKK